MKKAWRGALIALALAACREAPAGSAPQRQGELALLTSLPIGLGEGFNLDAPKHPLMSRLEQSYSVRLVDGPDGLRVRGLLLAVQPQALTAERLVALDRWVRDGGRMLLFADPRFVWDSGQRLTDKFRPPYTFPDTGLLQHWGLTLATDTDGPAMRQLGGAEIETGSPGHLSAARGSLCRVSPDGLVARCKLGRGRAVVVADADLVQVGVPGGLDGPTDHNLEAIVTELEQLSGA